MKIQTSRVVVAFVFGLSAVVGMCRGAALHGTDYVEGGIGVFKYGDKVIDDIFGEHVFLRGEFNKNVAKHLDVAGKVEAIHGSGESEGIDLTSDGLDGAAQLNFQFLPGAKVAPMSLEVSGCSTTRSKVLPVAIKNQRIRRILAGMSAAVSNLT